MKRLIYILSFLMVLPRLWAQEVNEIEPPVEDEVVVGAIGGTVDVSALGGAVYSIPIQVPEGMAVCSPTCPLYTTAKAGMVCLVGVGILEAFRPLPVWGKPTIMMAR